MLHLSSVHVVNQLNNYEYFNEELNERQLFLKVQNT